MMSLLYDESGTSLESVDTQIRLCRWFDIVGDHAIGRAHQKLNRLIEMSVKMQLAVLPRSSGCWLKPQPHLSAPHGNSHKHDY